jgi:hypothetical protein
MIYSILGVELTLYWNSISGVYSFSTTGQLIPLIIGGTDLIRTVYGVVKLRQLSGRAPKRDISDIIKCLLLTPFGD